MIPAIPNIGGGGGATSLDFGSSAKASGDMTGGSFKGSTRGSVVFGNNNDSKTMYWVIGGVLLSIGAIYVLKK